MKVESVETLLDLGIRINSLNNLRGSLLCETPVSLQCNIFGSCVVGAFTYTGHGSMKNTRVGRYCSIADVDFLSGYVHPLDRTTTHPLTYNGTRQFDFYPGYHEITQRHLMRYKNPVNTGELQLHIGNDVWIASNVKIVKPVVIGNGVVVAACSLVNKDIHSYEVSAGVPAKFIKHRLDPQLIETLNACPWWNLDLSCAESGLLGDPEKYVEWASIGSNYLQAPWLDTKCWSLKRVKDEIFIEEIASI